MAESKTSSNKLDSFAVVGNVVRLYKKYFFEVLIIGIIVALPQFFQEIAKTESLSPEQIILQTLLWAIANLLLGTLISCTFLWFLDKRESGASIDLWTAAKQSSSRLFSVILVQLAVSFITGIGYLLLFFPGVIWSLMYSQAFAYVLLENKGAGEALTRSRELTNGSKRVIFSVYAQIYIPLLVLMGIIYYGMHLFLPTLFDSLNTITIIYGIFGSGLSAIIIYALWTSLRKLKSASN